MRIPLNKNTLGPNEIEAAKAVLDSGWFTMGERCREFESAFARYLGVNHAIMVNSGSSANLLALFALANPLIPTAERPPIKPGAEIIVPALTWSTTVWPVLQAGATPVFVDCDPRTLQTRPEAIEAAITSATVGIVIVHVLGGAVDAAAVADIARRKRLWLIEDTCEALGIDWDRRKVGTFGHFGTYSFFFSHHITTIEGGMIVTHDDDLADLLRATRSHGWIREMQGRDQVASRYPDIDPRFLFLTTGFNLRPTEINAVIGIEQLKRLDGFNERRQAIARRLDAGLAELENRGVLDLIRHDARSVPSPFGYTVICRSPDVRRRFAAHLEDKGIETRPVICGNLARQPAFQHVKYRISGTLDGANRVMDCGLYWGTNPFMTDDEVDYVIETVKRFFQ